MPTQAVDDAKNTSLGDERLNRRFAAILAARAASPHEQGLTCFDTNAERKAYYRFVENPRVHHHQLLESHRERTRQRAVARAHVLVVHDTTRLLFSCRNGVLRDRLGHPSSKKQGFDWHASLALDAQSPFSCLGLITSQPFSRLSSHDNADDVDFWRGLGGIFENEQMRWMRGVELAEAQLSDCAQVIHLMDREGDDYEGLFSMIASDYDFVIRSNYDRRVHVGPKAKDTAKLNELLGEEPFLAVKTINLAARTAEQARRSYPVRPARQAVVSIRSKTMSLRRPTTVPAASAPKMLEVNAVEVVELEPPEAQEPVRWVLLTRLPTGSAEECLQIVRWYQARWTIEEYFKALKTGCGFLKSQLRSADALLRQLAIDAQLACDAMHLRDMARKDGEQAADKVLTQVQMLVLAQIFSRITAESTVEEAWLAIAELGGHFKHNGPPGWLVLCRGLRKLNDRAKAFEDAAQLLADNPALAALLTARNTSD